MIEIDEDKKLMPFFDKRMASEVPGDSLGDEFKDTIWKITGGNDKQGFPMKQGVLVNHRVRLLLKKGHSCFRERRKGVRKRKSVRGCIVGSDINVLCLMLLKKGPEEIPGLTDVEYPRRFGPKRATRIRKLFNLDKKDDVRKFVVRREPKEGQKKGKAPKIQRLITKRLLQRKRSWKKTIKGRAVRAKKLKADYDVRLAEYHQELKDKRAADVAKKKKATDKKKKDE